MKPDVEGYELAALRGAVHLVENHRPPLFLLEVNGATVRQGRP